MIRVALAPVVVAYAWWVAGLAHFSVLALVAVVGTGSLTVAWASRKRRRRPTGPVRPAGLGPWVVVLGALLGWELLAYSLSPRSSHPTLSSMADVALRPRLVEAGAFLVWLALGWRLASR
ncbi:MAG: hypothetical protein M3396_07380 [Actinomycetota bacterium]|nr:hypothetical protein [Actinomycetota bacterium]MDQ3575642.1 hypothetical protein [Actinomycetota bacterium]